MDLKSKVKEVTDISSNNEVGVAVEGCPSFISPLDKVKDVCYTIGVKKIRVFFKNIILYPNGGENVEGTIII